jgi:hypothetical protein
MAWSAPKTWTAGAATSAEFNTEIRDNLLWLKAALTTLGQTSDSELRAILSAGYGASMTKTSQSVADATDVAISFDAADEEWDDAAFHNDTNKARFTIPATGTYELKVWVQFAAVSGDSAGSSRREVWFEKNGVDEFNRVRIGNTGAVAATAITNAVDVEAVAGDYFVVRVRQTSGSTLNANARYQIRRIAA